MAANKKDLVLNCSRWIQVFKQERDDRKQCPRSVNAIFIMFDISDPVGSAVCMGTVNKDAITAACKGILNKINRDKSPIIDPYGRNT